MICFMDRIFEKSVITTLNWKGIRGLSKNKF